MALLSPVFFCAFVVRALALALALRGDHWRDPGPLARSEGGGSADLPGYAILVPLYREANVAPGLVRALDRLDWPQEKRHIVFVTEEDDAATRLALKAAIAGCRGMEILVVPDGQPRTKPRALTYALSRARGDLVVVYDAEDEPEPDQLRRAYRQLNRPGERIGCVQARLNVYNARQSLIARGIA